jgi:glycine/D-amino acid oxidase-like deaminating enzyme
MRSYWSNTAIPDPGFAPLAADIDAEVAIIGGGFTGISAAGHLLERGVDTVVLEARTVGWGASGRNGGSATPRYKMGFAQLARTLGDEQARLLHRRLHEGLDAIERNAASFEIPCDFRRCGQITAAHSPRTLATLQQDVDWLHGTGGDRVPRILSAAELRERLGVDLYVGGYFDERGGGFHPLSYIRGVARALAQRGVRISEDSPVTAIRHEPNGIALHTATGSVVRTKSVIVATDAYTTPGLTPDFLHHRHLTVASSIITTAPLGKDALAAILPGRHIVADTFTLLNYFQMLPDARLMFGGRGAVTGSENAPHIHRLLERRMRRLLPAVGDTPVTHRWSGLVGLTDDNFPHIGEVAPKVHCGFGYGGRGVVLSHVLGRTLAMRAIGEPDELGPITARFPERIPFYWLKRPALRLAVRYFALRDRMEAKR